jgi:hypothetical protein
MPGSAPQWNVPRGTLNLPKWLWKLNFPLFQVYEPVLKSIDLDLLGLSALLLHFYHLGSR